MLKNLNAIMATNLIHEKEGNFIEDLHNNYAKIYIHEQEPEGKIKQPTYHKNIKMVDYIFFVEFFPSE